MQTKSGVLHYQSEALVTEKEVEREDGGQALIYSQDPLIETGPGADGKFFVRLQSWDDKDFQDKDRAHQSMRALIGRRIRVTVEVLD